MAVIHGKKECVYFVGFPAPGKPAGVYLVKIGHSINLDQRIKQLQTSCPYTLVILGVIYETEENTATYIEQYLHGMFYGWRVEGEWFLMDCGDFEDVAGKFEFEEDYTWI